MIDDRNITTSDLRAGLTRTSAVLRLTREWRSTWLARAVFGRFAPEAGCGNSALAPGQFSATRLCARRGEAMPDVWRYSARGADHAEAGALSEFVAAGHAGWCRASVPKRRRS